MARKRGRKRSPRGSKAPQPKPPAKQQRPRRRQQVASRRPNPPHVNALLKMNGKCPYPYGPNAHIPEAVCAQPAQWLTVTYQTSIDAKATGTFFVVNTKNAINDVAMVQSSGVNYALPTAGIVDINTYTFLPVTMNNQIAADQVGVDHGSGFCRVVGYEYSWKTTGTKFNEGGVVFIGDTGKQLAQVDPTLGVPSPVSTAFQLPNVLGSGASAPLENRSNSYHSTPHNPGLSNFANRPAYYYGSESIDYTTRAGDATTNGFDFGILFTPATDGLILFNVRITYEHNLAMPGISGTRARGPPTHVSPANPQAASSAHTAVVASKMRQRTGGVANTFVTRATNYLEGKVAQGAKYLSDGAMMYAGASLMSMLGGGAAAIERGAGPIITEVTEDAAPLLLM